MSDFLGVDMPEFQLRPDRRAYLREHGTLTESVNKAGEKTYESKIESAQVVDDDGTLIYYGMEEVVRRERGMCAIEQTPQWVLRAIMQHAKGHYAQRDNAVWPATKWDVGYGIKQVFEMNMIDDDVMPLKLRKALLNYGAPLISRFLIRENPEYAETHFIGIRRRAVKTAEDGQMELDIVDRKKVKTPNYGLDDYLFPELRELTTDAVTAPEGAHGDE